MIPIHSAPDKGGGEYSAPTVDILNIVPEKGFAASPDAPDDYDGTNDNGIY